VRTLSDEFLVGKQIENGAYDSVLSKKENESMLVRQLPAMDDDDDGKRKAAFFVGRSDNAKGGTQFKNQECGGGVQHRVLILGGVVFGWGQSQNASNADPAALTFLKHESK
jgi:hypothetical protein